MDPGTDDEHDAEARANIFVSYSRKDGAFVDRLESALKARGFAPKIDRSDIYAFGDWRRRIEELIVKADTIVFVLSPDAVASEVCQWEVGIAAELKKRFAPIVCRAVETEKIPPERARLNFIFFDDEARFDARADSLVEALATDIDWIRKHTEFGELARRWSQAGRPGPKGLLLRPPVLEEAERWIASRPADAPMPTEATQRLITESRKSESERRNKLLFGLGAGMLVVASFGVAATFQWREATKQRELAEFQSTLANRSAAESERYRKSAEHRSSLLSANVASRLSEQGEIDQALLLLLDGAKYYDETSAPDEIRISLYKAIDRKAKISVYDTPEGTIDYQSMGEIFLVDEIKNDIYIVAGSPEPRLILKGKASDKKIENIKYFDYNKTLVILRNDGSVDTLRLDDLRLHKVAVMPSIDQMQKVIGGKLLTGSIESDISPGIFVIQKYEIEGNELSPTYALSILDVALNKKYVFRSKSVERPIVVRKGYSLIILDQGSKDKLAAESRGAYGTLRNDGQYSLFDRSFNSLRCIKIMDKISMAFFKKMAPYYPNDCARYEYTDDSDNKIVHQIFSYDTKEDDMSTGGWSIIKTNNVVFKNDESYDIDQYFKSVNPENSPLTWVGIHNKSQKLFAIINKNIVSGELPEYSSVGSYVPRVLFTHSAAPTSALSLDESKLVAFERATHSLIVHHLDNGIDKKYGILPADKTSILDSDKPIDMLHHGFCAYTSYPQAKVERIAPEIDVKYNYSLNEGAEITEIG